MLLSKAVGLGLLVPVAWGSYRVVDAATLRTILPLPNPAHRRLVAWARILPTATRRRVCFLGARLARDTELNVTRPMPVLALSPRDRVAEGAVPQWEAFFADLGPMDRWTIRAGGRTVATIPVPSREDTRLILEAGADPRWVGAALPFQEKRASGAGFGPLWVSGAPRGRTTKRIGLGPPHRRRLLGPPWWMKMRLDALDQAGRSARA